MSRVHDPASDSHAEASANDVLSDVLRSVRLTGSMLFLVDASAPFMSWAPRAEAIRRVTLPAAQHLISYHIVEQGSCWGGLAGAAPQRLETGDVLVVPHGDAYYLADPPDARPGYGSDEATAFFRAMSGGRMPVVIREGGSGPASASFICGFLGCDRRPFNPVLAALPRFMVLRRGAAKDDRLHHLIEFALSELRDRSAGRHSMLLRLAELMFAEVVRRHLDFLPEAQAGWLAGLKDALVARALSLLHGDPARQWTLQALAEESGASRSVLAERFAYLVGQPPMQYLSQWRLQLAARLLDQPGSKVVAVAAAVGYQSEAAFSRAFRRSTAVPPSRWRHRGQDQVDSTGPTVLRSPNG